MTIKYIARLTILVAAFQALSAWSEIVYTSGSSFSVPDYFKSTSLDINRDGATDVVFGGKVEETINGSSSEPAFVFDVSSSDNSGLLVAAGYVQILSAGEEIGDSPNWGANALLVENTGQSWTGPLGTKGNGYLGIHFKAADGLHYGWIQVRLPKANEFAFAPVVVDWAYESTPDKAIVAGARPVYFTVTFNDNSGMPRNRNPFWGGGLFILETNTEGCTLYYNLQLSPSIKPIRAGIFVGRAPRTIAGRLINNLGAGSLTNEPPIVLSSSGEVSFGGPQSLLLPFIVYNGQMTLNANQVAELMSGRFCVDVEFNLNKFRSAKEDISGRVVRYD
jgi:hypothetical protein